MQEGWIEMRSGADAPSQGDHGCCAVVGHECAPRQRALFALRRNVVFQTLSAIRDVVRRSVESLMGKKLADSSEGPLQSFANV